jgi:NTE family protein
MLSRPDVLVLGAGGVLGESWMMGVLAGVEDTTGFDLRRCEHFVGTSAGSIVAAHLVAGERPVRPRSTGTELEPAGQPEANGLATTALEVARRAGAWTLAAAAPLAPLTLGLAKPGGALLRAVVLHRIANPRATLDDLRERIARSGARFDGRLRIATVERRTGRRVVFGRPGAPFATVADAVAASCSVPWLFEPVRISDREYVDGGVWSPTNLDAAPAGRDTHVLCLFPTAALPGSVTRTVLRSSVGLELLTLRHRGAAVQMVAPDHESSNAMGSDLMDREPRRRVLAAGYRQGLELAAATER